MAKKRSRTRIDSRKRGYSIPTANPRLFSIRHVVPVRTLPLSSLQDNRLRSWSNYQIPPTHVSVRSARPLKPRRIISPTHNLFSFERLPKHAVVCVRRKIRREVLFASGHGGGRHKRKYNRSQNSKIRCKK